MKMFVSFVIIRDVSKKKEEKSIDYNWSTSLMIGDPVYIAHGKMLAKS